MSGENTKLQQETNLKGDVKSAIEAGSIKHRLLLIDAKKKTVAELRCQSLFQLKELQNQITDNLCKLRDLGRPLAVDPHDIARTSLLSSDSLAGLRGLVNLQMLVLLAYHVRDIAIPLIANDLITHEKVSNSPPMLTKLHASLGIELSPRELPATGQRLPLLVHLYFLPQLLHLSGLFDRKTRR